MNGYEAIHTDAAWIDLTARGRLRATGEDRARLLHAMCTNDVKNLSDGQGLYAFFLTAQGRILSDAYIYNRGDSLFLDTEPEIGEKLRGHLDKYIIADDVLIDAQQGWGCIGIEGPKSLDRARFLGLPVPESQYQSEKWKDGFVVRGALHWTEGVRVFGSSQTIAELVSQLREASMEQIGLEEARIVRIENGIPRYGEDIGERYLVQETGQLRAVHFSKGCYLGQEIVERVRSRAQVHRYLRALRIKDSSAPPSGTKLTLGGNNAGEITSAVYSPVLGEVAALGYVRAEVLESSQSLHVGSTDPTVEAHLAAAQTKQAS